MVVLGKKSEDVRLALAKTLVANGDTIDKAFMVRTWVFSQFLVLTLRF